MLRSIPLFPLGLVLYPNERLPLHIFEPRYKEMVAYCEEEDAPFGIVLFDEGAMAQVGCTAYIERTINRYEDGRLDILVRGDARFRVLSVYDEEAYITADVEPISEPKQRAKRDLRERAITQHMKLLELAGRTVRPSLYQDVREVSYVLAHNAGLSTEQKQNVLELLTENERITYLIEHFEVLIPRVEQVEEVRRKIQSNGHLKDFPPEEQEGENGKKG